MNIKLYIHCSDCMAKKERMEDSLMVFVEDVIFDHDTIRKYECINCKHQIEINVGVED